MPVLFKLVGIAFSMSLDFRAANGIVFLHSFLYLFYGRRFLLLYSLVFATTAFTWFFYIFFWGLDLAFYYSLVAVIAASVLFWHRGGRIYALLFTAFFRGDHSQSGLLLLWPECLAFSFPAISSSLSEFNGLLLLSSLVLVAVKRSNMGILHR